MRRFQSTIGKNLHLLNYNYYCGDRLIVINTNFFLLSIFILGIPATSVPREKMFSTAGDIDTT